MTAGRAVVKIALLAAVAVMHLPLTGWARVRPRQAGRPSPGGPTTVLSPFEPSDRSGGHRAVKDFVGLLGRKRALDVVIVADVARPEPWRRRAGAILTWPLSLPVQCRSLVLGDTALEARLSGADTIVCEFFSTALLLYLHRPTASRIVLRDHEVPIRKIDMERRATRGLTALVHTARLATCYLVSSAVYRQVDRIVTLTDEDRAALVSWFPFAASRSVAVPVPFDAPAVDLPAAAPPPLRDVVMVANFYHRPNAEALVWFVAECAPHLEPGFTLHLCGEDAPLDALRLALPPGFTLVRHGFVDDIEAASCGARIAIAPVVSGGGIRMKNLLLAAIGKAIVTTPLGNQGIGFVDGHDAVVAAGGAEMAARMNALAHAPAEVARLGAQARALVTQRFAPEAVGTRLEATLE